MTYRVYLRYPLQKVSDKTVTESRAVAEFAFAELKGRIELNGQDVVAIFNENQVRIDAHDFSNQ